MTNPVQPDQPSHRLTVVSHLAAAAAHLILVGEEQAAFAAVERAFEVLSALVPRCQHHHDPENDDDPNFNRQILRFVEQLEALGCKS